MKRKIKLTEDKWNKKVVKQAKSEAAKNVKEYEKVKQDRSSEPQPLLDEAEREQLKAAATMQANVLLMTEPLFVVAKDLFVNRSLAIENNNAARVRQCLKDAQEFLDLYMEQL